MPLSDWQVHADMSYYRSFHASYGYDGKFVAASRNPAPSQFEKARLFITLFHYFLVISWAHHDSKIYVAYICQSVSCSLVTNSFAAQLSQGRRRSEVRMSSSSSWSLLSMLSFLYYCLTHYICLYACLSSVVGTAWDGGRSGTRILPQSWQGCVVFKAREHEHSGPWNTREACHAGVIWAREITCRCSQVITVLHVSQTWLIDLPTLEHIRSSHAYLWAANVATILSDPELFSRSREWASAVGYL